VTSGRPAVRYRPHLDGLRAVAVYLVVAFHAGLGHVEAGFIGVDVFFVLSGFLVTKLLVVDLVRRGRPDARRFYARRSRRILPAAILVLVATAAAYRALAPPADVEAAMGGFRAASVYVANWFFIGQSTDYFASDLTRSPVLHFWSLAVEEQFYLLWPLVLGGLFLLARRFGSAKWAILRAAVAACALASAVAAVVLAGDNLARAYYGTDTRAYQLLAGALVALTPGLARLGGRAGRIAAASAIPAVAGIVILATPLVGVGPITRGLLVTVATVVLIVALENARGGPVTTILASGPMTALGRVSYGTYLWHWPIIVLLALEAELAPLAVFAISAAGATLLAAISYGLMEHPIRSTRRLDGYAIPVVAGGLACSLVVGLVLMPRFLDGGSAEIAGIGGSGGPGPSLTNWRIAADDVPGLPDCLGRPAAACTLVRGGDPHVVVVGDSIARMWIPALVQSAMSDGFTLSAAIMPGCPWLRGIYFRQTQSTWNQCSEHRNDWYSRMIPELDPDVVIVSQLDPESSLDAKRDKSVVANDGSVIAPGDPGFEQFLQERVDESMTALSAPARRIVVIEPTASAPLAADPLRCLSQGRDPATCAFFGPVEPTTLEGILRARADADPGVVTLDLDRAVCPRYPQCDAVVDDVIAYRDGSHLTATYARTLAGPLGSALAAAGVDLRP